jgi:hypothetical protein
MGEKEKRKQIATRRHMFSGQEVVYAIPDIVRMQVVDMIAEGYDVKVIVEGRQEVEWHET